MSSTLMMANKAPSPRIRKIRAALIAAGLDVLASRPIDAIVIDEVVAAAGVAKGRFFNHFADKHAFADAVATEVRAEVEAEEARANAGLTDRVARIAGGMVVAAAEADHPLNRGLRDDIAAALAAGHLRPEAATSGLAYLLGLCQVVMIVLGETRPPAPAAAARLEEMLAMGLAGLGVIEALAATVIAEVLAGWRA